MTGRPGLPAAPLMELITHRADEAGLTRRAFVRDRFGDNADRNWWRWLAGQTVRRDIADEVCIALGVHPTHVWPEWDTPPRIGGAMPPDLSWFDQAACHDTGPEAFFPDSPHDVPAAAQLLCMTCTVFDACFTYGLTQRYGVWAGTSEAERDRIRKQRGIVLHDTPDPTFHPLEEPA